MAKILRPGQPYSFSDYFELTYSIDDILKELEISYRRYALILPSIEYDQAKTEVLKETILSNLKYSRLTSEDARKQLIIAPIILDICKTAELELKIEYRINASLQLKGIVDYYIEQGKNLIIVEAKQVDLIKGFTQLAVELIALDQWIETEAATLYGVVTTGEDWKFGTYDRAKKEITEDTKLYRVPEEIQQLMNIFLGIVS